VNDSALALKPKIIFANKCDLLLQSSSSSSSSSSDWKDEMLALGKKLNVPVIFGSAEHGDNLGNLARVIRLGVQQTADDDAVREIEKLRRKQDLLAD
jgi:hypothetical protein